MQDPKIKGYIINESPSIMTKPEIVTSNNVDRVIIKTTLQDADVRNRNKRIYPKTVIQKGLEAPFVRERLETKTFFGEAGHPLKPDIQRQLYLDQSNISHRVNEVWWEGNVLKGYVEAANTARGKDFDGLVRQGCKVAFSLRAVGPITEKRGDTVTVKDPLSIFSYDWVIHPSHASAYMDEIISEDANMSLMQTLCESSSSMFEPYYEDATNYLIEASNNLRIISDTMGIDLNEKIYGQTIMVNEDASKIYIKDQYDTIVVNAEEYLSDEIGRYMGNFGKKSLNENKQIFDMGENFDSISESKLSDAVSSMKSSAAKKIKLVKGIDTTKLSKKEKKKQQENLNNLRNDLKEKSSVKVKKSNARNMDFRPVKKSVDTTTSSETTKTKSSDSSEKKTNIVKKVGSHISQNKGKYAVGAAAAIGTAALGYGAYKAYKKYKAKQNEKDDKDLNECMIDIFEENGQLYISDEDMDFLLEACDYDLNVNQIMENIENTLISEGLINSGETKSVNIEQDKKELKREAERLYRAIIHSLTPALRQCKDAEGEDKFKRWCGYDYSSSKVATVSVCIFSCQRLYNKLRDDYDNFTERVEKEAINLMKRLKNMTKYKLYLEEDDGNYFIMLEKNNSMSESTEDILEEGVLQNIGRNAAKSRAGQVGIAIGKKKIQHDLNNMEEEAERLYKIAIAKFTPALTFAKKHDDVFEDSILDKRGSSIILFTLSCQSIDGTKGKEFQINSAKDYNDLIDKHIVPDLKALVKFLQTKTKYKVFINYNEDSFSIGIRK